MVARRAPAARSREDIVAAILEALEPLNDALDAAGRMQELERQRALDEAERLNFITDRARSVINGAVDNLFERYERGDGPQRETKEAALRLRKPLDALIEALGDVPAHNVFALWARYHKLPAILCDFQGLRARMEQMIPSGNTDLLKASCAGKAFLLISALSKKNPTTTPGQPLRVIAGLLYEIVAKNSEEDLKRACDECVRQMRAQREAAIGAACSAARLVFEWPGNRKVGRWPLLFGQKPADRAGTKKKRTATKKKCGKGVRPRQ
jgi:hypothetical protein